MCLVNVKILLLKMFSGMSYVLGLDDFMFDVRVCAGIKLWDNGDSIQFQNVTTVWFYVSKTR